MIFSHFLAYSHGAAWRVPTYMRWLYDPMRLPPRPCSMVGVNAILPPHVAGCHVAGCCTYAFFHQASTASIDFAMRAPMRASTPVLPL